MVGRRKRGEEKAEDCLRGCREEGRERGGRLGWGRNLGQLFARPLRMLLLGHHAVSGAAVCGWIVPRSRPVGWKSLDVSGHPSNI